MQTLDAGCRRLGANSCWSLVLYFTPLIPASPSTSNVRLGLIGSQPSEPAI